MLIIVSKHALKTVLGELGNVQFPHESAHLAARFFKGFFIVHDALDPREPAVSRILIKRDVRAKAHIFLTLARPFRLGLETAS